MFNFKLLLLNARKNPVGLIMILLLIAFSVALSLSVHLQERAFRLGSAKAADRFDLVIGGLGSDAQLVLSTVFLQPAALPLISAGHLSTLEQDERVDWAAPLAFGDFSKGMPIVGTNAVFIQKQSESLQQGRVFQHSFEAVVGAKTGYQIGDHFSPLHGQVGETGTHSHNEVKFTVVGILPENHSLWDKAIFVPIETTWSMHSQTQHPLTARKTIQQHAVSAIIVKPKSIAGAYQLRQQYRTTQTQALFPAEVLVRMYGLLGDGKQVLVWVSVVTQILVAIALLMIITLYLHQQRPQIAAWRIFGAPQHKILFFIWFTLFVIIALGMALGILLGYLASLFIAQQISLKSGFTLPVQFELSDAYRLMAYFAFALFAALLPSLSLYRKAPLSGLKTQEL